MPLGSVAGLAVPIPFRNGLARFLDVPTRNLITHNLVSRNLATHNLVAGSQPGTLAQNLRRVRQPAIAAHETSSCNASSEAGWLGFKPVTTTLQG